VLGAGNGIFMEIIDRGEIFSLVRPYFDRRKLSGPPSSARAGQAGREPEDHDGDDNHYEYGQHSCRNDAFVHGWRWASRLIKNWIDTSGKKSVSDLRHEDLVEILRSITLDPRAVAALLEKNKPEVSEDSCERVIHP